MTPKHTPGPWAIGNDDTPWTCGDAQTAIELGEPLGHTEILFPIFNAEGDPLAYLPWEPLCSEARAHELRANARLIAKAPELVALLADVGRWLEAALTRGQISRGTANRDGDLVSQIRTLLAEIDGGNQ